MKRLNENDGHLQLPGPLKQLMELRHHLRYPANIAARLRQCSRWMTIIILHIDHNNRRFAAKHQLI